MKSTEQNTLRDIEKAEKYLGKSFKKTEKKAIAVGRSVIGHKRFSRFLRILGPGLVTGAADDDPSGIATYSQAGAAQGLGLLWAFPLMFPLLLFVQESCARIGAITGKGMAAVIKENYSRKVLYACVMLVVAANIINIGSDLGAMAETARLFIPLPFSVLAIFFAVLIIVLVVTIRYKTYARMLKWLALALFAYPITAILVGQNWPHVLAQTFSFHPKLTFDTIYIFVGMLGTTISPYLFFWDTSEVVEEEIAKKNTAVIGVDDKKTRRFLHSLRLDNFVGMALATLTAWFITIACAATLNAHGVTNIDTAAQAAQALEPLVQGFPHSGTIAKLIFSVGIIGIGLLAVPVLAGSSSYAISEAIGLKEGLHNRFKRAVSFYVIIILATLAGLLINFLGIDPIKALVFTAVFNGIAAVPLLFMIARIGSSEKIMGRYKNGVISNIFVRLTFGIMLAAALFLFVSFLR